MLIMLVKLSRYKYILFEPLIPGLICLEVEIVIVNLKKYKSPGSDQILAELIQARGKVSLSVIHKLVNYVWNKEEVRKESIIVPIHKMAIN
jgi:hypothetical protein